MASISLRALCFAWFLATAMVAMAMVAMGCGPSFVAVTPPGFVELNDQEPEYSYRAVSVEGVVVAVREIEHDPKGDADFWTRAVQSHMRDRDGYALIEEKKVTTRSGLQGTQLRFGRDIEGESMLYYVTVFVTDKHIFLLEFGGTKEEIERREAELARFVETFQKK